MLFVDSHCHLTVPRFVERKDENEDEEEFFRKYAVDAIIERANAVGVKYMLAIGTELSDVEEIREIADTHKHVFRSVGIHPQEAAKHLQLYKREEIARIIKEHCALPKTVAIGEIGLDYHFERETEPQQKDLFHFQLDLAKECNLPVSIHSRDATNDTIAVLSDHRNVCGVIHCFSGEKEFARKALDLGFYISISGVVTFKKADELRESIKFIPTDRLLIETDSPFLAPAPFRGKINEPAFVGYVAEKIAEVRETTVERIAQETSDNFFRLFSKIQF